MRTISAIYKGDRAVELLEDVDVPRNGVVWVIVPGEQDEREMHRQLQSAAEVVLAKLWDNEEDDVWHEYL